MNARKANNTIDKARQLQRKLYLAAKANRKRRFHAIYDKILRRDILHKAWQQVKQNGGVGGVDGISIEDVQAYGEEKFLEEIEQELKEGRYRPLPVMRVYIPKKDGGKRPLGIPILKDRVVQAAAKIVIEPIFEADFKETSYGFRPKRNAHMALDKIKDLSNQGYRWILDADIKGYFDSINHDKLMKLVEMRISDRRILKLIRNWLKTGVMEEGDHKDSERGSPQGGVISPLLSNIYLNYLDTVWERQYSRFGTLVRYADDFVILCKQQWEAQVAKKAVEGIFQRLELTLHPGKTRIVNNWVGKPGYDFLGFHHKRVMRERKDGSIRAVSVRWASKKSMNKMREKIQNVLAAKANLQNSLDDMVRFMNPILRGFKTYYGIGKDERWYLQQIDKYVVERFALWSNAKRQKRYRRGGIKQMYEILKIKGIVKLAT